MGYKGQIRAGNVICKEANVLKELFFPFLN